MRVAAAGPHLHSLTLSEIRFRVRAGSYLSGSTSVLTAIKSPSIGPRPAIGRQAAPKDEAWHIAANIAKLPELLKKS